MKLNNDLLVIDLETTSGQDENGYQTNNDIIQIGAVLLDRNLQIVSEFDSLVKPREPVSEFITILTGIKNSDVQNAPEFIEVIQFFEFWINQHVKNIKQVRLCAHGTYFDIPILRRLYKEYRLTFPFSGTAFDTKTLAMLWMSMSNHRTDKLSVEHLASIMKITPTGRYHDALVDAKTEADIVRRIFLDFNQGTFVDGKLVKLIT